MPIIIVEQEHVQSPAIKVPIPVLVVVELLIGARVSNHPRQKTETAEATQQEQQGTETVCSDKERRKNTLDMGLGLQGKHDEQHWTLQDQPRAEKRRVMR